MTASTRRVVVGAGREPEFAVDPGDVVDDGPFGHGQVFGDGFVVAGSGGGGGSCYTHGPGVSGARVTGAGNNGTVNSGNGKVVFSYPRPAAVAP